MTARRGRWRLAVGAVVFVLWAPASLVGVPLAALLAATRPEGRTRTITLAVTALAAAFLAGTSGTALGAVYGAWAVLVTAAFLGGVLVSPSAFWRQATRATVLAAVALAALATVLWGSDWLAFLRWEATHQAEAATRLVRWARPDAFAVLDRVAQFAGATFPATLMLQAVAGLALAWQLHVRVATHPLGSGLRPFREFRMGDVWIWGLILAAAGWLRGYDVLAQNLGVVLGTFYALQGAAIVVAFAAAVGISTMALLVTAAVATALAIPLVFIVPGLWTLGITDTWLEYRRRIAARVASSGK